MTTKSKPQIQPDELAQIVESVFGSMMGLQASQSDLPWSTDGDLLTAAVHLAGDWNGAVLLECSGQQACRFAGRFLSIDPPDTVDDVVRDVLRELANMIGGNLKCALMRGIRLSIPRMAEDGGDSLRVSGAEICERLAFRCSDGPFSITVVAMPC